MLHEGPLTAILYVDRTKNARRLSEFSRLQPRFVDLHQDDDPFVVARNGLYWPLGAVLFHRFLRCEWRASPPILLRLRSLVCPRPRTQRIITLPYRTVSVTPPMVESGVASRRGPSFSYPNLAERNPPQDKHLCAFE